MPLNMLNTLNILDGVGQWLVHTVGWLSIELLVFACVVYAITRSDLVRSSRVKRWLWTLVLVKPLVAAALGWPLHLATDSRADIAPMAAGLCKRSCSRQAGTHRYRRPPTAQRRP